MPPALRALSVYLATHPQLALWATDMVVGVAD